MTQELEPIEAVLQSPDSTPEHTARALGTLAKLLDPNSEAASGHSTQMAEQIFGRAVDLVAAMPTVADGPELANCLLAIARWRYANRSRKALRCSITCVEAYITARNVNDRIGWATVTLRSCPPTGCFSYKALSGAPGLTITI